MHRSRLLAVATVFEHCLSPGSREPSPAAGHICCTSTSVNSFLSCIPAAPDEQAPLFLRVWNTLILLNSLVWIIAYFRIESSFIHWVCVYDCGDYLVKILLEVLAFALPVPDSFTWQSWCLPFFLEVIEIVTSQCAALCMMDFLHRAFFALFCSSSPYVLRDNCGTPVLTSEQEFGDWACTNNQVKDPAMYWL